jgi:hypothetical protein
MTGRDQGLRSPEKERRIITHSLYRPFDDDAVCEIQPIILD